jgi:DNA polymerase-3 subunit epsilon
MSDAERIERYQQRFEQTWDDHDAIDKLRFVVLDSETTGLDPKTDRIVSLGAVAMRSGDILLEDSFDALIKVDENTSAVTVHGITRDEARAGLDECEALIRFLDYLRDGVIVGHHIGHDVATLNAACQRHWGFRLRNRELDTMDLTLHLERDGAFAGRPPIRRFTLDALCGMFGVVPHGRHTAPGDAFLTAQVFQRLLRLAVRYGRTTLGAVSEPYAEDGAGPA